MTTRETPKLALPRAARAIAAALVRVLFRVRVRDLHHFHAAGSRVLIVANHVSLLDGIMLYLFLPQAPAFAVDAGMARRWYARAMLRFVIWQETDTQSPHALKAISRLVRDGQRVVIFPEGRITTTGTLMQIYDGPGMIADKADATILPIAIEGLEHSRASALAGLLRRRWLPAVTLTVLAPRKLALDAGLHGAPRRAAATAAMASIMRDVAFAAVYRRESLFAALIRAAHKHGAGRIVLEDQRGARLSYRQMLLRAFVLGAVIARTTARGERVGIMLPSTAAAVVALFACAARGRTAAMLNFSAGVRGLLTAVETAGIKRVFTSRAFVDAAELHAETAALAERARVVYLEDLRDGIGIVTRLGGVIAALAPALAHRLLCRRLAADDAAVVLFTSGSEGIPKGVVLSHANLLANYAQVHMLIDLTRRDRVLNALPVFHAFGLLGGVLLPLFKGTSTFQYPSPLHYRIIPQLCYQLGVSCLFGTTTFLRGYARHAQAYDFHKLRFVISGAEKLSEDVRQLWAENFGIRILEGYGTTEASPVLAVNNPLACRRGTVGQLLSGIEHYLEPVEGIAEGGELVVRGPNIMLGYLFHGSDGAIIQPWTQAAGAGWYATGDVVTVDGEGYVTIKGRAKRFAKIGGEMVSLAAVEELAAAVWPERRHAAIALADARKGEQIVLYTDVAGATRADLMAAVRASGMSELALPRQVVHLSEIPLLGSGKIDYPALRELVSRPG